MDRPRLFRVLRIAVTVMSLTACALLIALWVRSYWWCDAFLGGYSTYLVKLESQRGELEFLVFDPNDPGIVVVPIWNLENTPISWPAKNQDTQAPRIFSNIGMGWRFAPSGFLLFLPLWQLVAMFAAFAAAPHTRLLKRFSLRTLLIATTLVAVALGLIALAR